MATTDKRILRHTRLRKKISGSAECPRLAIHFSGRHIQAQVIDDTLGKTIASAHTTEADLKAAGKLHANTQVAILVAQTLAERAISKGVKKIVFDRGGFQYHGKVKAFADAVRQAGIKF